MKSASAWSPASGESLDQAECKQGGRWRDAQSGSLTRPHMLTGFWILVAALCLAAGGLWFLQRRLIYFPLAQAAPPIASVLTGGEDVIFRTADGLRLNGWFIPARAPGPQGTVLVFNGNAGDRSFRAPLAAALNQAGFSVLLFDYRGYGGNPGSPSEEGLLNDARAARAYVVGRPDVDASRLAYFGESLGAAVAIALARERPPAALVLRSPFTSLTDMARLHYPVPRVDLVLRDHFDSITNIPYLTCPVLVIAGDQDRIVPPNQSRRLYDAAQQPKQFVLINGADHNDFALLAGDKLVHELTGFLNEALRVRQNGL
jgi:uncharacterized protein